MLLITEFPWLKLSDQLSLIVPIAMIGRNGRENAWLFCSALDGPGVADLPIDTTDSSDLARIPTVLTVLS